MPEDPPPPFPWGWDAGNWNFVLDRTASLSNAGERTGCGGGMVFQSDCWLIYIQLCFCFCTLIVGGTKGTGANDFNPVNVISPSFLMRNAIRVRPGHDS